LSVASWY